MENLDKKYLIKLYCFNFIAFNYRENELKEKNPSFNKKKIGRNFILYDTGFSNLLHI